ncbi:hypothetical protein GTO91_11500 [Heliobacterium undosum]|uniref:Peptidase C39-like domain-containing protein n=1 Tax=Heliomicrobium undosum TaxID=121734 RepID=A0A845L3Q4_9FIRM|nr:hypothetical protein [Heliomicrobium undosum]MZP30336.1 hypothetical protein [Heliomicrobium undosum]
MKKGFLRLIGLSCSLLMLALPTASFADGSSGDKISASEAKKAAAFQIALDKKANKDSTWLSKKIQLQEPVPVYDTSDSVFSYIVNITSDGEKAGFVEVSADPDEYPILSFSCEGSAMDSEQIGQLKSKSKEKATSEKVVAIGPAYYGLKRELSDGSAKIISLKEEISIAKEENVPKPKKKIEQNNDARKLRKQIDDIFPGEIGTTSDGVTDSLSFETGSNSFTLIGGVPDLQQTTSSLWGGGYSGCSPTSAANIMKYWASKGYSSLTSGLTNEQLLYALRQAMGTSSSGSTPVNNISPGMQSFARSHGASTAKAWYLSATYSAYKSGINTYGPNVISFYSQTYYGTHSVTGVGWTQYTVNGSTAGHEYMEVHDNWSVTPYSVFVAFGRNYSGIYFDQFAPKY